MCVRSETRRTIDVEWRKTIDVEWRGSWDVRRTKYWSYLSTITPLYYLFICACINIIHIVQCNDVFDVEVLCYLILTNSFNHLMILLMCQQARNDRVQWLIVYLSVNISYIDSQSRCDKSQKSTDMTDSSNRRQSYKEPHFGCCHVIHAELCVSYQGPLRVPNVDNLFLFCDVTDITDHGGEVIFSLFLPTETEYKNSILHAQEPTLCIHVSGVYFQGCRFW